MSLENSKEIAVLKAEMSFVRTTLDRIENNHLAHLAADVKEVMSKIASLDITDAKREPAFNLGQQIVSSIIMAVVAGIMLLVFK